MAQQAWGLGNVVSWHEGVLLACGGVGALLAATADANAGGFAVREQSAWGQGTSFAGVAAGGDPVGDVLESGDHDADAGLAKRVGAERHHAVFGEYARPRGRRSPRPWAAPAIPPTDALVPAAYYSWQFRPDMWLGLSVNSPFGLSVSFPINWAGGQYAAGSSYLKTYNATPSFAYRINDMISVGVGVQIQYAKADLSHCVTAPCRRRWAACGIVGPRLGLWLYRRRHLDADADDDHRHWLSFRHQPEDRRHARSLPRLQSFNAASTTLNLPDIVSARLAPALDAAVDRAGHGRVDELEPHRHVERRMVQRRRLCSTTLPFQYKDGWLFSVGAEYMWNDR